MDKRGILIIEDDPDDKELVLRAFNKCDIKVDIKVIRDGAEAIEYFNTFGKSEETKGSISPALILMDLKLPKNEGKELLKHLRQLPSGKLVPVIILSSSGEPRDINECYELGANSYIIKPIDFTVFVENIRQLYNYWFCINIPPKL